MIAAGVVSKFILLVTKYSKWMLYHAEHQIPEAGGSQTGARASFL